jgi:hypothetical protein
MPGGRPSGVAPDGLCVSVREFGPLEWKNRKDNGESTWQKSSDARTVVERGQFKPMSERGSGDWLICDSCGHLALPENPTFKCTCAECVGIEEEPTRRK